MQTGRVIVFLFGLGSLAASFPDYPVKPARGYSTAVEKLGLVVAAVPVEDQMEQRKYFGVDLRSKGYIPVLLAIENTTPIESFLLNKESLTYSPAPRSRSKLADPSKASRAENTIAAVGEVPTIYTFIATIAAAKSKELRQHLLKTELQSETLSPGGSTHGFIFVPGVPGIHRDRRSNW